MAKQHEKTRAGDEPARHGGIHRLQLRKLQELRLCFCQHRQQQHGDEGFEREGPAQLAQRQPVKGQVQHKENLAEANARGVVQQERQPRRAAGQQARIGEKRHAHRNQQHPGEDRHGVFSEGVGHRHGGRNSGGGGGAGHG